MRHVARFLSVVVVLFLSAQPSALAAAGTTSLLRLTVTEPWLGNMGSVGLFRATYAPGGSSQELSKGSSQLFFVETGVITARLSEGEGAPVNLGGGAGSAARLATPAEDSALQIAAGEAGLLLTGTTVELRNEGSTPAAVLWLVSSAANFASRGHPTGARDVTFDQLAGGGKQAIPPSPLVIGLDRLTVAPDATTTAAPEPSVTKVGSVDARRTGDLSTASDGSARNRSATPLDIYVLTIAAAGSNPGTPTSATPGP